MQKAMSVAGRQITKRRIIIVLILIFAFLLRIHGLNEKQPGTDENWSLKHVNQVLHGEFFKYAGTHAHMPLFYYMLAGTTYIYNSIYAMRLFVVLLGTLSIFLAYLFAKEIFGEKIALFSAFLLALSPFHVLYSQHIKDYILLFVLFIAATLLLYRFLITQNNRLLHVITLLYVASFYTHVFAVFYIFGHAMAVLAFYAMHKLRHIRYYLASLFVTAAAAAAWLPIFASQYRVNITEGLLVTIDELKGYEIAYPLHKFAIAVDISAILEKFPILIIVVPLLSVTLLFGFAKLAKQEPCKVMFMGAVFFVPIAALGLLGFFFPVYSFRYLSYLILIYVVMLARSITYIKNTYLKTSILLITLAGWLFALYYYFSSVVRPSWAIDIAI